MVGLPLVVAFFGVGRLWWLQYFRGGLVAVFGSPDGYGIPLLWFVALVFLGGAVRWDVAPELEIYSLPSLLWCFVSRRWLLLKLVLFLDGYPGFLKGVFAKVSFGWEWVGVSWVHLLVLRPELPFAS